MWKHLRTLANKMTSDTVGILYNFPILQVSRLLKEIRNGYIRLSRICIIDIYIYYTCRRSSHCSLRTFHMVYTDIHLRSVSSKPRPDEPKEPKKWVEIHVLWIRFAMFFLGGDPQKIGGDKKEP